MITLHTFGPAFGLPDPSPFVTKAEILLKLAGLSYACRPTPPMAVRRAPKGKLPFLIDDGEVIADSTFIRWHIERKYKIDFDQGLSAAERGISWAVEKMLEEHLYWAIVCERWGDDENFHRGPAAFFARVPRFLRPLVQRLARARVAGMAKAHGMGRHGNAEVAELAIRDIDAVAAVMGSRPYLMGAAPCGSDATVFAFLAGIMCPLFASEIRRHLGQHTHLQAYVRRLRAHFYPEAASAPPPRP